MIPKWVTSEVVLEALFRETKAGQTGVSYIGPCRLVLDKRDEKTGKLTVYKRDTRHRIGSLVVARPEA